MRLKSDIAGLIMVVTVMLSGISDAGEQATVVTEKNRNISFKLFAPDKNPTTGVITIYNEHGFSKQLVIDGGEYSYALPPDTYILKAESSRFKNVTLELDLSRNFRPEINLRFEKKK